MKVLDRLSAENARTYALRVLQYNIINLELVPGSAVSENELSAVLHLSRTCLLYTSRPMCFKCLCAICSLLH